MSLVVQRLGRVLARVDDGEHGLQEHIVIESCTQAVIFFQCYHTATNHGRRPDSETENTATWEDVFYFSICAPEFHSCFCFFSSTSDVGLVVSGGEEAVPAKIQRKS